MSSHIRYLCIVVIFGLTLGGCASLPDSTAHTTDGLNSVHASRALRIAARPEFDLQQFDGLMLGSIRLRDTNTDTEEQQEQELLRAQFEQRLVPLTAQASSNRLRMDAMLYDIRPVEPALNVLSTLALFLPLDSGALTLEITYYDAQGTLQARRIERLTGSITDIAESFSRYGRLHTALENWAAQCAAWQTCVLGE